MSESSDEDDKGFVANFGRMHRRQRRIMAESLILVADDSSEIRDFLEEALTKLGNYQVKSVGDGLSALSLVQELNPSLIITDQQMPNLSGVDLIRRLRRDHPYLPVILMTAESSEALAVSALRAGATDYLTKPFEPDYLLDVVQRCLDRTQVLEESSQEIAKESIDPVSPIDQTLQLDAPTIDVRTTSGLIELDEVLRTAVDTAVRLTGAEEGSILLLDEDTGELYMRASKNFDDDFARAFRVQVKDSLAGRAISSGETVRIDETTPQKIKTSYLVHSLCYVPLQVRGRALGVLGVDNRTPGKKLTDHDIAILTTMADYAALAIENAQLYLRSEQERIQLETILTEIENGVIVVDKDYRLLLINQTALDGLGVERDCLGLHADEIFKDPKLIALLKAGGNQSKREELELGDGRVFSAQRTPIEGVGQAVVTQDITHLKELDRIKSDFVTTVSHDLRSPLTAILGYIELIERAGAVNELQKEFIHRVQSSVQQISNLISDLLDLGRIEAGLDTTKEVIDIVELSREAMVCAEGSAQKAGVKFEGSIKQDPEFVFGDPIRLQQMIGNLLDNAIKYSKPGGEVAFDVHSEDEQVILRINDNGPGIPRDEQPFLFERFFRASNVPDEVPGTGLGLSIVKSILDNHNGRIWVDSKVGEGTTFTVVLPITKG
jgi:signal transduction histidine kinase/CheY-like chemotaxis protein